MVKNFFQGISLKNLAPLGSRPLLCWCLQSVMEFGKFDSVWVSTDHQVCHLVIIMSY